jgi:hypothetical protein
MGRSVKSRIQKHWNFTGLRALLMFSKRKNLANSVGVWSDPPNLELMVHRS